MENIKFIRTITDFINRNRTIVGNCVYYALNNGNRIKTYCEQCGVRIEVHNKINGDIDGVYLPFTNYFAKKRCSPEAPLWD